MVNCTVLHMVKGNSEKIVRSNLYRAVFGLESLVYKSICSLEKNTNTHKDI